MASNISVTPGSGATVAADDIGGGLLAQRVKLTLGTTGVGNDASAGSGVNGVGVQRVTIATDQTTITTQLPAALGQTTMAGSTSVTIASNQGAITTQLPTAIGTAASAASLSVVTASDDPLIGIKTETAPASDTASSGLNGRLQRVAQNLTTVNSTLGNTNTQLPTTVSGSTQVTITRPANVTAYPANGVIVGALTFATGLTSGQRGMITCADLQLQISAVPAGMANMRLYFYNVTPPSAFSNTTAWDLPSGDRASFLGYIDLGTPIDLGSTCYVQSQNINFQFQLSGSANLFGYLVTIGGFTPAANSEVYLLRLGIVGL